MNAARRARKRANQRSGCHDCGVYTQPWKGPSEWYMVHDAVWEAAGMDYGFLCVGCLEQRLGRPITGADLKPIPVNKPGMYNDTPRLAALKQEAAA